MKGQILPYRIEPLKLVRKYFENGVVEVWAITEEGQDVACLFNYEEGES